MEKDQEQKQPTYHFATESQKKQGNVNIQGVNYKHQGEIIEEKKVDGKQQVEKEFFCYRDRPIG